MRRLLPFAACARRKDEGSLAVAAKYCSRLLECGGSEEEWAKKQLREIRGLESRPM
jgi:hypothetical protein